MSACAHDRNYSEPRFGQAARGFFVQKDVQGSTGRGSGPGQGDSQRLTRRLPGNRGGKRLHRVALLAVPAGLRDGVEIVSFEYRNVEAGGGLLVCELELFDA